MDKKIYGLVLLYTTLPWVQADIIHDQSFGATLVLKGTDYQINAEQGLQAGNNLFYSFSQFDLAAGESATFNAPIQTTHIINRITGGNASYINGLIRSLSNADLYFFNPAGIAFGAAAQLDVNAAFYASTADSLTFSDSQTLALQDLSASQWSSADPSHFGFSQNTELSLNQSQLRSTQNLHFSAGSINAEDVLLESLTAIQLHAVDAGGSGLALNSDNLSPTSQASISLQNTQINSLNGLADIQLSGADIQLQNTVLDATNITPLLGGNIQISAKNLNLQQGSIINQLAVGQGKAGNISLDIGAQLNLENNASIRNRSNAIGAAGQIEIQASDISLSDNSIISSSSFATGIGGNIQINANNLSIQGSRSFIASQSNSRNSNAGDAGIMNLNISNIQLNNGASLVSSTQGSGAAGVIIINTENLSLTGEEAGIASRIQLTSAGTGAAGTVSINSQHISLEKGAFIATDTLTSGAGGVININSETLALSGQSQAGAGSFIIANADGGADGGSISINSNTLSLEDGAQIATSSFGQGNGGNINIEARNSFTASGEDNSGFQSGLFASSLGAENSPAQGGIISLKVGTLNLNNNARINTETTSQGAGGEIQVQALHIHIASGAQIQANSLGLGNAGTINLQAGDSIILRQAKINTATTKADGGNISINTPSYLYLDQSEISTSVAAKTGNGGNIVLNPEFLLLENSQIVAQAVAGDGGHIDIQTSALYEFSPSLISASSELGLDGIVAINTPDEDVSEGLVALIAQFNQSKLSHSVCQSAEKGQQASQMLVLQYLGSPLSSDDWQPSTYNSLLSVNMTDISNRSQHQALFRLVCAKTMPSQRIS